MLGWDEWNTALGWDESSPFVNASSLSLGVLVLCLWCFGTAALGNPVAQTCGRHPEEVVLERFSRCTVIRSTLWRKQQSPAWERDPLDSDRSKYPPRNTSTSSQNTCSQWLGVGRLQSLEGQLEVDPWDLENFQETPLAREWTQKQPFYWASHMRLLQETLALRSLATRQGSHCLLSPSQSWAGSQD